MQCDTKNLSNGNITNSHEKICNYKILFKKWQRPQSEQQRGNCLSEAAQSTCASNQTECEQRRAKKGNLFNARNYVFNKSNCNGIITLTENNIDKLQKSECVPAESLTLHLCFYFSLLCIMC